MLPRWKQAWSLAILALNVTRIAGLDERSLFDDALKEFEEAITTEVVDALDDTGGVLAHLNLTYATKPPISSRLITSGLHSEVTVGLYCESCENAVQPSAFNFASNIYSNWDSSWLGFALNSFDALFELDIDLSAGAEGDLTLSLLKFPARADGVVVEVDFQLYLVAKTEDPMSFTAGLNLSLNSPSAIMMPALDPVVQLNQSQRIGFDQSSFSLTPIFNASISKLDFDIQLSLRTVFSVTVEDINVGSLFLDLPAFNLNVNTLTNSLSNCQTPPSGTPPDEIYAELIHMNGDLVAELSYEILEGGQKGMLEHWNIWDALDECFAFFPGLGFIGAVPSTSKSALLTALPITTCTSGAGAGTTGTVAVGEALRGLSPGAKAGAVIGTLIGVTLVAIVAFFAGRGDLNHAVQKARTSPAWNAIPRPRSGKFDFKFLSRIRFNRRGTPDFSSVAPSEQTWQTSTNAPNTEYGGGYFPTSNTEMLQQQNLGYDSWQMFKEQPFMSVDETEAVTPAATFGQVYDYGDLTPTLGAGERDVPVVPQRNPSRYPGGQAEGLGLLQSPERLVMQGGVSRKPVPGQRR